MRNKRQWLPLDAYKTMDFSGKKKNIIVYKPVVEVEDGKVIRKWSSIRKTAKELYLTRQTVMNYCNNKTKKKQYNLMWEEDYRRNKHEDIKE